MSTPQSIRDAERQLASLAPSIGPREQLRQQVLEDASESSVRSRSKQRGSQSLVIAAVVVMVLSPLIGQLTRTKLPTGPSSKQVNAQALGATKQVGNFHWSLVDVFLRNQQRMRSRHMNR